MPSRKTIERISKPMALPIVAQTLDYTCGAACFDSMFKYFSGSSPGEMYFANELGSLALEYTPPENIVALAKQYGFVSELKEGAQISDLIEPLSNDEVIFVTWWDEDAGHYSLVRYLDADHISLMDPWTARQGLDNNIPLSNFITNWNARGSKMIRVRRG